MKPLLAALALLCVTSQAFPQVGRPSSTARTAAETRARAALALAAAPTFTVSHGFTVRTLRYPCTNCACTCTQGKCTCAAGECKCDACPALPPKSAYYRAYHQALAEHRGLLTVRGKPGWTWPMDELRALAAKENLVLVVVPDDDERLLVGVHRMDYDDGELVYWQPYGPQPPAPVYQPPPMAARRVFFGGGGSC